MKVAATGLDSPVAVLRPRPKDAEARSLARAEARERSVRRRVGITWGLLVFNSLTYYSSITHLPTAVGKSLAQAALPVALVLALSVNRRVIVRPNVFLCLVSLLIVGALVTTLQPQHLGTVYRTVRLAEFIAALWLLTPWWGRRDMPLLRYHLVSYSVLLASVVLGLLVAPGHALSGGRLVGVIWFIPATEVAHYAAIVLGVVVVLWLCGHVRGRPALAVVAGTGIILILTHTRTALVGLIAGLLVAGLSLIVAKARVRKLFAVAGAVTAIAIMTLSSFITAWLARGEGAQQLSNLTGRTLVWGPLLAYPRDAFQEIFGFGLSNGAFNGLPIDSNWLSSYEEQGLFGVVVCATMLLFLLVAAYFQPRSVQRALALFLITYLLIASFTQDGFTDASTYLLELTLAASLLAPAVGARRPV
jgi:hypothetical protein